MAVTAAGTPYVESSDLVANYPGASLSLANRVDQVMQAPTQNAQTGTTYTAVLLDAGKTVTLSNAAAVTLTIPAQATVAWVANAQLNFLNIGAGTVTITPAAGVTINGTQLTLATSKGGSLVRTALNVWTFTLTGDDSGLVLVSRVNLSAVSTVTVNNCFTAAYQNYMIIILLEGGGTTTFRLRVGGVDAAGSDYNQQRNSGSGASLTGQRLTGQTSWFGYSLVAGLTSINMQLFRPADAATTVAIVSQVRGTDVNIDSDGFFLGHTLATAYDGFTWAFGGSVTGNVCVYAYKN